MQNVEIEVQGSKIIITIDGAARLGPSASGKTVIVGTSGGNQPVAVEDATVFVGVNAYIK